MYLLRLQPLNFDAHNWEIPDAYKVLTPPAEGITPYFIWDGDKEWWDPLIAYQLTSMVKRGQYVYYSAKEDNTDDPFYNWIGCTPQGNDSWIRGRGLHDFDCINYVNPGCTRRHTYTEFQFIPKKMGNPLDVSMFYGDSFPKYLVIHGLLCTNCTVDFYNEAGVISQESVSCNSDEQPWQVLLHKRIMRDASAKNNPEIPAFLKDTVFIPLSSDTYKMIIKGDSSGMGVGLKLIGIAEAIPIGRTEGTSLSVGAIDYSRISYDDWGRMVLSQGKKAKTLKAEVHVIHKTKEQEEKIFRTLQACRATPTIFWAMNTLPENERISSLPFIFGILKNISREERSSIHKVFSLQIDGIPVDYTP